MKLKTLFTAGLLMLGAPFVAQANLSFDTQGVEGVITMDAFDWVQNSFLAEDGNLAITNFIDTGGACDTASCDFTVYTHGTLGTATLAGTSVWAPNLQDGTEVTYTLVFTETVTNVSLDGTTGFATADFSVVTTEAIRFEMYFDTNVDADPLTGSGYSDGTMILYGDAILSSTGAFTITTDTTVDPVASEDLDQAGADGNLNDYDGQETIPGTGSQGTIEIGGLVQDNNFFLDTLAAFGFDFSNLSQELPFTTVDPSDCFNSSGNYTGAAGGDVGESFTANGCNTAHVDGTFEQNEAGASGLVPVTSDINGFPTQGLYNGQLCNSADCPDFVAQTDPNSPIQVEVRIPEPGILALIGMGLGVLGLRRRRRT